MGRPTMPKKATVKHDRQKKHDEEMFTREFSEQEILEFREAFAMFVSKPCHFIENRIV
jgi:hypothetical protein